MAIRYLLKVQGFNPMAAAQYAHPALARLRDSGPFTWAGAAEGIVGTKGGANVWGPWQEGLGGLSYAAPDPIPEFRWQDYARPGAQGEVVRLKCGHEVLIAPATQDGAEIALDGTVGAPVGEYGRLASRVWDRLQSESVPFTDPDMLRLCRMALRSCSTLTDEEIHIHRLLSTGDVTAIWGAVSGLPKALCVAVSLPAEPPASTHGDSPAMKSTSSDDGQPTPAVPPSLPRAEP